MTPFKRALTSLERHPIKNGLLLVVVIILGIVLSGAISVRQAIIATEEKVIMNLPAVATLQFDFSTFQAETGETLAGQLGLQPTSAQIESVGNLPYVRVFDYTLNTHLHSHSLIWPSLNINTEQLPNDLQNMIEHPFGPFQSPRSLGGLMDSFTGVGVNNPMITDIETGLLKLVAGRTFTQAEIIENAMVVVISQAFATANNLFIGSTIQLENLVNDYRIMGTQGTGVFAVDRSQPEFVLASQSLEFEVIGIFEINQELDYNLPVHELRDALFSQMNFYTTIYLPSGVTEMTLDFVRDTMMVYADEFRAIGQGVLQEELFFQTIFVLNDPRNLAPFAESAAKLLPDFWEVADLSSTFAHVTASMDSILEVADLILIIAIGATVITLALMITLFLKERRHEIGIYLAIGEKKSNIIFQFLVETFLITTIGITISLFMGNLLSEGISRQMLEQTLVDQMIENPNDGPIPWELALFNSGAMPIAEVLEMYNTALNREMVFLFVGISFAVVFVSVIAPIWLVVKMEPKKILIY